MAADSPEQLHSLLAAALNAGDPDAAIELYELDAKLVVPPDGRLAAARCRSATRSSRRAHCSRPRTSA